MNEPIIRMEKIVKRYYVGKPNELEILHGIDLSVREGEFLSIVGESGSGKSTLMNIIGVLDRQTEGEYYLEGQDVNGMTDGVRSAIRNRRIGFVFQNFNLLPRANALKNVMVPLMYGKKRARDKKERAMEMLRMVDMEDRAGHRPNELSGGQKQRVAIARAMINDPAIILADEPTGALDSKTGHMVMDLFHKLHEGQGKTIVLITHSHELAAETQRIVTLFDGEIVADSAGGSGAYSAPFMVSGRKALEGNAGVSSGAGDGQHALPSGETVAGSADGCNNAEVTPPVLPKRETVAGSADGSSGAGDGQHALLDGETVTDAAKGGGR